MTSPRNLLEMWDLRLPPAESESAFNKILRIHNQEWETLVCVIWATIHQPMVQFLLRHEIFEIVFLFPVVTEQQTFFPMPTLEISIGSRKMQEGEKLWESISNLNVIEI